MLGLVHAVCLTYMFSSPTPALLLTTETVAERAAASAAAETSAIISSHHSLLVELSIHVLATSTSVFDLLLYLVIPTT